MKRKIIFLLTACIAVLSVNPYLSAQNEDNKSNGTLEVIGISIPDTIVFSPAKGMKITAGQITVYLVSGEDSFQGKVSFSGSFSLSGNAFSLPFDQAMQYAELDSECVIEAYNFNVPANFKAQKIRFLIDRREMYYNLEKDEWE